MGKWLKQSFNSLFFSFSSPTSVSIWSGGGMEVHVMSEKTEYEECVKYIKFWFGDELTSLCDIKEENIYIRKELVVGWLLTRGNLITGKTYFNLYPIIYERMDYEDRDEVHYAILGYTTTSFDSCGFEHIDIDEVLKKEKIIEILPAQPNTYYVTATYFVDSEIIGDCVAFSIGVMHNPDTKEIIEITKSKYYEWLKSYEFKEFVEKYKAKSKSKNNS